MILLEEDTLQRPKLRTDPSDRAPYRANAVALASGRSPSPNTTLPDYEASQAQHPSPHKRPFYRRIWHTKAGKAISYAFAIYSAIFVVIGIPAFVLVGPFKWVFVLHKPTTPQRGKAPFKWHGGDDFSHYGPLPPMPPPQLSGQIDLSFQNLGNFSCNTWIEPGVPHGKPNTTAAIGQVWLSHPSVYKLQMISASLSMRLAFPLGDGIILRTNSSSNNLTDYVSGSLRVDMNPDKNVSGIVLVANTRSSSFQLLQASSVCLTSFGNLTELILRIPDREESHLDTIDMDLQLLLPWTPAPINFKMFATHLPMFSQSFGDLRHVAFRRFELAGSNSTVTVASVRASSIVVQTSGAEISGNFSASENILLDTINGPIVAQVNLQVDERRYFSTPPKHPNFMTMFKTFNAPMNVSIAHVAGSEPARFGVVAENTQGAMTMTLDSVYTGLFELRTKAATALVQETPAATDSPLDEENELHFEKHVTSEWTHGWIGDTSDPKKYHHHEANRVKLLNSLAPIELRLARLRPSTAVRR
ncbi:hypothetical protein EDB92DRAFT_1816748 [Lactarius akahatsu]|uniref:Transmembrane protein n=1 Tax=Lactarius akahatsu TaxID=416441 RepID=A0AAD4LGB0_9AGAM|nr:hypothetical protein EDB92DRAFT_1816748 [Lactarius akahatsu]